MLGFTVPSTVRRDRLTTLADFLESFVKDDNFDLERFMFDYGTPEYIEGLREQSCGTAACAVGYMPFVDPVNWAYVPHRCSPEYKGCEIYSSSPASAAAHYFGFQTWSDFFSVVFESRGSYYTRQHVIDMLRLVAATPAGEEVGYGN